MIAALLAATVAQSAIAPIKPAGTRDIVYESLTAESVAAIVADLKMSNIAPGPTRGTLDLAAEPAPAADHRSLALGNYCSAYKIDNPVGAMLRSLVAQADRDGTPGAPDGLPLLTVKLDNARSYRRCVEVKETNARCITRVTLSGEAVRRAADGQVDRWPIRADVERDSSVGGFCGGMARALAVITREAGQQLLAAATTPPS